MDEAGSSRQQPLDEFEQLRRRVAELEGVESRLRGVLRLQEERFKAVVENVPGTVLIADPDGMIQFIHPGPGQLAPDQLLGTSIWDLIRPEELSASRERHARLLATGTPYETEYRGLHSDTWDRVRVGPLRQQGEIVGTVMVAVSVTARKLAEQAREESEQRYRALVDWAPVAIAVQRGLELVYLNQAALTLVGASRPEQLLGRNVMDFLHPDSRQLVVDALLQIANGKSPPLEQEAQLVRLDGEVVHVLGSGSLVHYRGEPAVQTVFIDISARKRAEQAREESEQRFRALAENAFDMISEIDERGHVVYVNPRVRDVLGYPPEAAIGQPLLGNLHPDFRDDAAERIRDGRPDRFDGRGRIRYRHADGSWRWLEFTARAFTTAKGEKRRVLVSHDITDLVAAEELARRAHEELEERVRERTASLSTANEKLRESIAERERAEVELADRAGELEKLNAELRTLQLRLIQAERLGAEEEAAGSVAHAINNPLAALIGTLEMAVEQSTIRAPLLGRSLALAQRIERVVDRTLRLLREGTLDLEPVDPSELLDELARDLRDRAAAQSVRIERKLAGGSSELVVDRALLSSALDSVAQNSLEAMLEGGTVWLEVEAVPGLNVVAFRISDSGSGIPDHLKETVFEPFFTTKAGGTGLGLAIARGVVHGHRGRIRIDDRPGGGTLVTIELPLQGTQRLARH